MTVETLRQICLALPGATEGVKWGQDLCFWVQESELPKPKARSKPRRATKRR